MHTGTLVPLFSDKHSHASFRLDFLVTATGLFHTHAFELRNPNFEYFGLHFSRTLIRSQCIYLYVTMIELTRSVACYSSSFRCVLVSI